MRLEDMLSSHKPANMFPYTFYGPILLLEWCVSKIPQDYDTWHDLRGFGLRLLIFFDFYPLFPTTL